MSLEDFFTWLALGLFPPRSTDPKEMRWRIAVSTFSGIAVATITLVAVIFFGRFGFVQLDVAHASDVVLQAKSIAQIDSAVNQLKSDNVDFRKGQLETQISRTALKVCKLIQALKDTKASPLLGDALATQQHILNDQKQQYMALGGTYQDESCDIILLAGN
jgi:hypothetical protein